LAQVGDKLGGFEAGGSVVVLTVKPDDSVPFSFYFGAIPEVNRDMEKGSLVAQATNSVLGRVEEEISAHTILHVRACLYREGGYAMNTRHCPLCGSDLITRTRGYRLWFRVLGVAGVSAGLFLVIAARSLTPAQPALSVVLLVGVPVVDVLSTIAIVVGGLPEATGWRFWRCYTCGASWATPPPWDPTRLET
jgi:hypothetical protein